MCDLGPNKIIVRGKPGTMDDKSYQWFGATVHSSGENGAIVVSIKVLMDLFNA